MRDRSKFQQGRSTFVCENCGKRTRETAVNEGLNLCPKCTELFQLENSLADGEITEVEFNIQSAEINSKYAEAK